MACYLEAAPPKKVKPPNNVTFKDSTKKVTTTKQVPGHGGRSYTTTTTTSVDPLRYYLHIQGWFDADGLNIEVVYNGPAQRLRRANGLGVGRMEPGDIIVAVDGNPVTSPDDYVNAMNTAGDNNPSLVLITVRDWRTGSDIDWYVKPNPF
jgi:S1-C subfamily serine protease